jgi:hypothetical protein
MSSDGGGRKEERKAMTPEEFQRSVDRAREDFQQAAAACGTRVENLRRKLAKAEEELDGLRAEHAARVSRIALAYAGLQAPADEDHASDQPPVNGNGKRKRAKQRSLDEPILALARELSTPDCTIPDILAEWKNRRPELITRSSVRRVFERHKVPVTVQGSSGSANPTRYRIETTLNEEKEGAATGQQQGV